MILLHFVDYEASHLLVLSEVVTFDLWRLVERVGLGAAICLTRIERVVRVRLVKQIKTVLIRLDLL